MLDARAAEVPRGEDQRPGAVAPMLAWIAGLYKVEEDAKERRNTPSGTTRPGRVAAQAAARAIAADPGHVPRLAGGRAAEGSAQEPDRRGDQYALNHWEALIRPLEAGFLEIDNGACERGSNPWRSGQRQERRMRVPVLRFSGPAARRVDRGEGGAISRAGSGPLQ